MPVLSKIAGAIAPKLLVEHRRRRITLDLLGIPHSGVSAFRQTARLAAHVERCRFDLWPEFLRREIERWSLVDVGANEGGFIDSVCALSPRAAIFAFEPQVLDGARRTLSHTAVVMLEINYAEHYTASGHFEDVHDRLSGAGFKLRGVSCPQMNRGVPLWADAVYVSRQFERQDAGQ